MYAAREGERAEQSGAEQSIKLKGQLARTLSAKSDSPHCLQSEPWHAS